MKTREIQKDDPPPLPLPQFKAFGKLITNEGDVIPEDLFNNVNGGTWSCIKKKNE